MLLYDLYSAAFVDQIDESTATCLLVLISVQGVQVDIVLWQLERRCTFLLLLCVEKPLAVSVHLL